MDVRRIRERRSNLSVRIVSAIVNEKIEIKRQSGWKYATSRLRKEERGGIKKEKIKCSIVIVLRVQWVLSEQEI